MVRSQLNVRGSQAWMAAVTGRLQRCRPVGRSGLLAEYPDLETTAAAYAEVSRRRAAGLLPPLGEVVPAARTILFDGVSDPAALARELSTWRLEPLDVVDGAEVEVPVRYDGPDVDEVAALWGTTPEGVARLHTAGEHRVAFCGFAPGFAYISGLPAQLAVPRRSTPRTVVPRGAVGLAGDLSGVYPRRSPGGWQLIGQTELAVWDPGRDPAALLVPGTRVRFVAG
ncbi:MAG: 5-oxoprolinase subunit B family protein [Acidimicrobiales bacterium]